MTDQPSCDRFTLPGDVPDAAYWRKGDRLEDALRRREAMRAEDEARGYSHSHPAGRGWIPQSRRLGLPEEQRTWFPTYHHDGEDYEFPHGTPQDLVAEIGCGQVFTRERRVRFLDHLAFQGNARAAARAVRVSHETAYRARRQDAAFAALWDAAMVHARAYGEQVLATQALDGVEVAIVRNGEIVGYQVKHDPRLLLAHLGRLDRRVETDYAARTRAEHFDALLAGYAGQAVPEGFADAALDGHDWDEAPPLPDLLPTHETYVTWCRAQALAGLGSDRSKEAEARAMDAAGEAAGALWDAWHEASLALVGKIVGEASEDAGEGQDEGKGEDRNEGNDEGKAQGSPLPLADEESETSSFVTPAKAGAQRAEESEGPLDPRVRGDDEAESQDLPIEVKSAPPACRPATARDCVTGVNTPPEGPSACDNSVLAEPGWRCHVPTVRGGVGDNDFPALS